MTLFTNKLRLFINWETCSLPLERPILWAWFETDKTISIEAFPHSKSSAIQMGLFSKLAPIKKAFTYLIMQCWDSFKSVFNDKFWILEVTLMKIPFIFSSQRDSKNQKPNRDLMLAAAICCLVAQLCPTLCDPMDCSPPGSSIHGIFQARILEWIAMPFSRGSSQPRVRTLTSYIIWETHRQLNRSFNNIRTEHLGKKAKEMFKWNRAFKSGQKWKKVALYILCIQTCNSAACRGTLFCLFLPWRQWKSSRSDVFVC